MRDMKNGSYVLEFAVAYEGKYRIKFNLMKDGYGKQKSGIYFFASNVFCNETSAPVRCPGTN